MSPNNKLIYLWAIITASLVFGLPSYFLVYNAPWAVVLAGLLGCLMGAAWAKWAILVGRAQPPRFWYSGAIGCVIAIVGSGLWAGISGAFTKWWEGWMFVVWYFAALTATPLGLFFGFVGSRWLKKRSLQADALYNPSAKLILFGYIAIALLFVVPGLITAFKRITLW